MIAHWIFIICLVLSFKCFACHGDKEANADGNFEVQYKCGGDRKLNEEEASEFLQSINEPPKQEVTETPEEIQNRESDERFERAVSTDNFAVLEPQDISRQMVRLQEELQRRKQSGESVEKIESQIRKLEALKLQRSGNSLAVANSVSQVPLPVQPSQQNNPVSEAEQAKLDEEFYRERDERDREYEERRRKRENSQRQLDSLAAERNSVEDRIRENDRKITQNENAPILFLWPGWITRLSDRNHERARLQQERESLNRQRQSITEREAEVRSEMGGFVTFMVFGK